jgi:hypothetical protein
LDWSVVWFLTPLLHAAALRGSGSFFACFVITLDASAYRLPVALQEHINWANTHKPLNLIEPKLVPMLPIVIESDFFIYTVRPGPVTRITMSPNIGRLLAVA